MAGLRGYPQPGYKAAARDFQSAPPLSPKRAPPVSVGDPVDAQLLQEMISGTAYSRKEQLLLDVIDVAAERLEREAPIAAKALRVPGRFLPVLNAFLAGFDLANAGIDAYQWWVSEQANPNNTNAGGAGNPDGYVAHQTGFLSDPWVPGANPTDAAFGYSNNTIGTMPPTFGAGPYSFEVYWYWSTPFVTSYFTRGLLGDTAPAGENLDAITRTYGVPVAPPPPAIPYKLIPYLRPDPTPEVEAKPQVDSGWYWTNGPTPPDMTTKDYPGRERKAQTTYKGWAALKLAGKLFGAATESCDFIEAMWDAIPEDTRVAYGYQYRKVTYKRKDGPTTVRLSRPTRDVKVDTGDGFYKIEKRQVETKQVKKKPPLVKDALGRKIVESTRLSRISCTRMALSFVKNPALIDDLDINQALINFVKNQIEDMAIGLPNKIANNAFVNTPGYDRPFGLGLGSAL